MARDDLRRAIVPARGPRSEVPPDVRARTRALEHRNPFLHVSTAIDERDSMRWWTRLSIGGLALAAVLALIGGSPIRLPMPTHAFGWVEPSCGLTRGSTAITRGDFTLAWRYNPLSFLAIAFGIVGAARAAIGAATGRWLSVQVRPRVVGWIVVVVAVALLWVHQQGNAELIIHSGH